MAWVAMFMFLLDDGYADADAQPWVGATFVIDKCPTVENANQADTDSDGVGDACRRA